MNIQWYPGHMTKTRRMMEENISLVDIVIELLDARLPFSSKNPEIDNLARNKKRIVILNKVDLADEKKTKEWRAYFEDKGFKVIEVNSITGKGIKDITEVSKELMAEKLERLRLRGRLFTPTRAMIVGIPNVGKSTLINNMVGKKVQSVGNKPGVTKNLNFLPTKYGITLLDSPGILWPKLDNIVHAYNMATIGSIKKEVLNISDIGMYIINFYLKSYPNILKDIYKTSESDAIEVFDKLSLKWGFTKNGETDFTKVSERLYNDIIGGKIKGITLDEEKTDN